MFKKIGKFIIALLSITAMVYVMSGTGAYAQDRQMCEVEHTYTETIPDMVFPFKDAKCGRNVAKGTTEYVYVRDLDRFHLLSTHR